MLFVADPIYAVEFNSTNWLEWLGERMRIS